MAGARPPSTSKRSTDRLVRPRIAYDQLEMRSRSVIRPRPILAISVIIGASFAGCTSPPASSKDRVRVAPSSGFLPVKVTSVTATLEPYNPQFGNHGIPAEQVNFTVGTMARYFSCKVDVLRAGRIVGTTKAVMASPLERTGSVTESVAVEGIRGDTFTGKPSDAHVTCRAP
jgi:hypothetical protein